MSLQLTNLIIGYQHKAVAGPLKLTLPSGGMIALLGSNGAGKSTLLRTLAGHLAPVSGTLSLPKKHRVAYLPQTSTLLTHSPISVRELVTMGLWGKLGAFGRPCNHDRTAIEQILETLGLDDVTDAPISDLSGGQMQRALFARLAMQDGNLILLDEPFSALDDAGQHAILAVLKSWHQSGKTIIAAVHDVSVAQHFPTWLELDKDGAVLAPRVGPAPTPPESQLRVISGGIG